MDRREAVVLIMLDLSAAFDVIDHQILLKRLENRFGIRDSALAWLRSYLSDRVQYVVVDESRSIDAKLERGVPQGSVLGPLLFSLFMTPLGDIARKHGLQDHFYADDSQFYISFKPIKENISPVIHQIESCISEVRLWMLQNSLKLNDDKTELMVFVSPSRANLVKDLQIHIGDVVINPSSVVRDLGVNLDSGLTMTAHVNSVCKAAYQQLRVISHLRPYISTATARTLVQNLVTVRIDYCNSLLYGLPLNLLNRLQLVQNCAARLVFRLRKRSHVTPCMISLHWLPVTVRMQQKLNVLTFRCLQGDGPVYLSSLLEKQVPVRALRSQEVCNLKVPSCRTKIGERSFSCAAPVLWNSLPTHLKNEQNVTSFKRHLKTHLFQLAYEC